MIKNKDVFYMHQALIIAEKGRGSTSPNPMVGAIIVKKGKIVGRGFHKKAGTPHAEIYAIKEAGENARGSTLYVTLEPCNTYGKTPPCAPEIYKAGIKKVFIATKDPNPVNRNKGIKYLRNHGIDVKVGILREEATKINEAYNKFITKGMPFVTVKVAMSLDGKIATRTGSSKWISSYKSRNLVKKLRKEVDAVLIGRKTFLKDRPRLKGVKNKIILGKGRIDMLRLMKQLAKKNIMHVLIEGGGETIASAMEAKLVDKLYVFIAPKIIGGRSAPTPVDGIGIKNIGQAMPIVNMKAERIGKDILISGLLN